MPNCLEPGCPNRAILGSDFCGDHQVGGKPIIYLKNERECDQPSRPNSAGDEPNVPNSGENDD